MTIVNDACTINVLMIIIDNVAYPHSLSKHRHKVTLQFGASLTYDTSSVNYDRNMFIIQATDEGLWTGSAKANRIEPKIWLGRVFIFKLQFTIAWPIQAQLSLKLKTRPRFCPVFLSFSMFWIILQKGAGEWGLTTTYNVKCPEWSYYMAPIIEEYS